MDSRYGECPVICGQTTEPATEFCGGCPVKKADKRFEKDTLAELDRQLGDGWKKYSFEALQNSVINTVILDKQDDHDSWFTGTEILIRVLRIEEQKINKIERQNLINRLNGTGANKNKRTNGERD